MTLINKVNEAFDCSDRRSNLKLKINERYYYHRKGCNMDGECGKCSFGYRKPNSGYACKIVLSRVITVHMTDKRYGPWRKNRWF